MSSVGPDSHSAAERTGVTVGPQSFGLRSLTHTKAGDEGEQKKKLAADASDEGEAESLEN